MVNEVTLEFNMESKNAIIYILFKRTKLVGLTVVYCTNRNGYVFGKCHWFLIQSIDCFISIDVILNVDGSINNLFYVASSLWNFDSLSMIAGYNFPNI